MYDVITKKDYFSWYDRGYVDKTHHSIKGAQDAFILSVLDEMSELKMVEIGGGNSRILSRLSHLNECWNIDKFEGVGSGPKQVPNWENIKIVKSYLGDFDDKIPDGYFDVLFSISVVEHINTDRFGDFFRDCFRILKPGGLMLHSIDQYVLDQAREYNYRIDTIKESVEMSGFDWYLSPQVDKNITFKSSYASNSDLTFAQWNTVDPKTRAENEIGQCISLKLRANKKKVRSL